MSCEYFSSMPQDMVGRRPGSTGGKKVDQTQSRHAHCSSPACPLSLCSPLRNPKGECRSSVCASSSPRLASLPRHTTHASRTRLSLSCHELERKPSSQCHMWQLPVQSSCETALRSWIRPGWRGAKCVKAPQMHGSWVARRRWAAKQAVISASGSKWARVGERGGTWGRQ